MPCSTGTARSAKDLATQANYDGFLEQLAREDLVPGTVTIDDKWQDAYGTCRPDPAKWEDLRGWIANRHAQGQRVLLWWKAWDPEGLPPELCVRNRDGVPVAFDPTNPAARDELRRAVARMLAAEGLDADGLKVDFTARTPGGSALSTHGDAHHKGARGDTGRRGWRRRLGRRGRRPGATGAARHHNRHGQREKCDDQPQHHPPCSSPRRLTHLAEPHRRVGRRGSRLPPSHHEQPGPPPAPVWRRPPRGDATFAVAAR